MKLFIMFAVTLVFYVVAVIFAPWWAAASFLAAMGVVITAEYMGDTGRFKRK